MIGLFLLLMAGHGLADFALQSDYIAREKHHCWWVMSAHCSIHALFVYLFTGSILLFVVEYLAHMLIDYLKCNGVISFNIDQGLHTACKVFYVLLIGLGALS